MDNLARQTSARRAASLTVGSFPGSMFGHFVELACKVAERSPQKRFRTGCVLLTSKWDILSVGWSHLSDLRMKQTWSIHAEHHALLRIPRPKREELSMAFIATLTARGNLTSARPCTSCAELLWMQGIEFFCYSRPYNLTRGEAKEASDLFTMDSAENLVKDLKSLHRCTDGDGN